ncbi:hypothetical protein Acsp04_23740 [Actinomadura sp. NBRC 104425]|uniref:hypothetical protein n=1 Tax=Actinomadura sp. NBRC 104425 TaxID=3032204 RepID=UPI00249FB1AA|nr:hypothetical protein [Actinomadura sp. NBRC 104425]GLZ12139.1 hypothetical protein Acsp04_23740 [Actinomadura sp. NBRC 104425]
MGSRIGEVRVGREIVPSELGRGPVWWPDGDTNELSESARASCLEVIRRAYPGWRVFVSDRGRWWATRGPLGAEQMRVGCQASLDADTPARLCELLAAETARDEQVLGTACQTRR